MKSLIKLLILCLAASMLTACGEKVNTDVESVNKDKGEQVEVQPRDRDGGNAR